MQNVSPHHPASPLPARVVPQPWEDLPSLITRTAAQMHYRNPLWIVRPQETEESIETRNLCFLWKAADYQLLRKFLALDEEALYQCTYHRFAARLQPPEQWHSGLQLRSGAIQRPLLGDGSSSRDFRPFSAASVCPYCLREGTPYARLFWNFRALVICSVHNTFLVHQCPGCYKPIPTLRPSLTHCPYCKVGDYRQVQGVAAGGGSFFLIGQKLISHHLTGVNVKQDSSMMLLAGSPLLELPSWDYFHLLEAFLDSLPALFPDDPLLQAESEIRSQLGRGAEMRRPFTLSEWSVLTATFHYIFASWPEHFFAFLDALIRSRGGERVVNYERQDTGPIGYKWIYKNLSDSAFLFLREAYECYLKTRYIGESRIPAAERCCLSIAQVQKALGVFRDEVDDLVDQGSLCVARGPVRVQEKTLRMRIERESVEKLCREWEGLLPLYRVASLLSAGANTLRVLREKRWLIPKRGPDIDGYPVELYSSTEVYAFSTALLSRAMNVPHVAGESITLHALFGNRMANIGDALEAIFDGQLIPADARTKKPLLQRLALSHAQLHRWQNAPKAEGEERILLTREEVSKVLGIRKHVVTHQVERNLLIEEEGEDLSHPLFRWESIEVFRQTYVFVREAAALLDVYPANVYVYMDEGKIRPVLGRNDVADNVIFLFLRDDISSLLLDALSTDKDCCK
jgi:hypothetical protein